MMRGVLFITAVVLFFAFLVGGIAKRAEELKEEQAAKAAKAATEAFEQGYIAACKDFYSGKVKYELVENEDGSREWKKKADFNSVSSNSNQ